MSGFVQIARAPATVAALFLIILPALRPAEKYLGSWLWWVPYAAICLSIVFFVARNSSSILSKVLSSKTFIFGIPSFMAVVSTLFYPLADSLKLTMQGQDQDDCTILGVNALFSGANPVSTPTYFGNPCSNLLGAIFPHIPFVWSNLMGLAGPGFFFAAILFLYFSGVNRLRIGMFVAVMAATPATLELMVNGSDFVFIGFMSLVAVLLVNRTAIDGQFRKVHLAVLTVLVGLISSTRINMPIFAIPFGLIMLFRRKNWVVFTLVVTTIVVIPNLIVYLADPANFAPLHLVSKGQTLVPGVFYLLMLGSSVLAIGVGFLAWSKNVVSELSLVLLIFSPHLIFLAFGDLVFNRQFDVFWWEGANYLYLLTPMLAWFAILSLTKERDSLVKR